MRILIWLIFLLMLYAGIVATFEGLLGYFQPANPSTLVITTTDTQGGQDDRVLARIDIDGKLYVAANHWPRDWYESALARPDVFVTIDGNRSARVAVPVSGDEHARVDGARPLGLGFRFLTGFPPRYFLRLEPAATSGDASG